MTKNLNALIIGLSIIITAGILAHSFKTRNKLNNTISVTGLGKQDFVSDLIVWNGRFMEKSTNLKEAYAGLDKKREYIKNYLLSKGIKMDKIVFSSVNIEKEYDDEFNNEGKKIKSVFTGYALHQSVQIESNEVDKVENISRQITELINAGIEIYSDMPQYYYTKLAELKIRMIAEATKDANLRAQKIASNAQASIGHLKNADMGVFQITGQNSSEDYSAGGSFNTTSKRKTASITIKLEYEVN